jgi:hypothetical protein
VCGGTGDGGYKNENGECNISYLIKAELIYCINGHQIGGRGKKSRQAVEKEASRIKKR